VSAAQVLHERVPGGEDPQPGHGLDAAHRPKPPFELHVVGFDSVVRVLLAVVPRRRAQLVEDPGVGARSVMTSTGTTPVVVLARWKNRRAASVFRLVEAYTSMTCPN
jgi:hypothetical protein